MRWAGATWRCQLRNVGAGGARTWVVPGPLGAFPRAPRSEGHSGLGSGETAEGTLLWLAKSLGFEGKRPCKGSTKLRVESGVRPGGLRPGLETPRAAAAANPTGGPRFARAAPSSDPTSSSTARFSSGSRTGAVGIGPRGLAPGAGGAHLECLQAPSSIPWTWSCQPPSPPPARCQIPGVSGPCGWEGRTEESTSL